MSRKSDRKERALLQAPLLTTESREDFEALHKEIERDIQPHGFVEQMYMDDIAMIVHEIRRLRRCRVAIINTGLLAALERLLRHLLKEPDERPDFEFEIKSYALEWFVDPEGKKFVSALLSEFGLNQSAIEAEATLPSLPDLQTIDRMLTSLEFRRDRALSCIAKDRDSLASRLRESADRILAVNNHLQLVHPSGKNSRA